MSEQASNRHHDFKWLLADMRPMRAPKVTYVDSEYVKGKFSDILGKVIVSFRPVRTEWTEMGPRRRLSGDFPHGYTERAVNAGQIDRHSADPVDFYSQALWTASIAKWQLLPSVLQSLLMSK